MPARRQIRRRDTGDSGRRTAVGEVEPMSDLDSLESVLSGAEVAAEVAPQEPIDEGVKEPGPEAEPASEVPPAPEPKKDDPESWTKAAVLDERRKRQELERELAELRKQHDAPEQKRPSVLDDEEGAFRHSDERFQEAITATRINLSREVMIDLKPDYAEKEAAFIELAKTQPQLIVQMRNAPSPAKFAYEQGAKHLEFQAMQDVDSYKAKLREEVRAELLKEQELEKQKDAEKAAAIKPSFAKLRSVDTNEPVSESLDDIARGSRY